MSAIDFKKLLAEARAERSRAAVKQAAPGAPTPTAAAARQPEPEPELLLPELPPLTVTSRPPLTHADYDVGGGLSVRAGAPEVAAGGLLYIPEFITAEEEAALLGLLYCPMAAKRWGGGTGTGEAQRRTQNWGGRPGSVDTGELPQFARQLVTALVSAGVFEPQHAPNHVLVNECVATAHLPLPPVAITNAAATAAISLRGGYGYIPPACSLPLTALHAVRGGVGTADFPQVACLSLGGPASMKLWRSFDDAEAAEKGGGPGPAAQIFLRPRSLNVLAGDVYSRLLHSIDATSVDTVLESCVNAAACGVAPGHKVPREARRLSLVFVHKLKGT